MWNERINEFLDGERNISEATDEERNEIYIYRKIISIYAARMDYVPSEEGKDEFLKKIRSRKKTKWVWWSVAAAAIFLSLFIPFYVVPTVKEKRLMAMEPQKRLELKMEKVRQINVDFDTVRTVMDGF